MVWGLFPVDPLPGENQYFIFGKGTYKVGRRGCDIIINKDKGVSRIHSEIIVDDMICIDHFQKKSSNSSSKVRIRDCSKYGTFINKNDGSKGKVHEFPDKETVLMDGALVSFGTGNANYRFCFVSLVFSAYSTNPLEIKQLQNKISSIGASVAKNWTMQCTHVVIDDFIPIDDEIIDIIVAKKPLVSFSWIELIVGKTICTEIPSYHSQTPTLTLEGVSIKVTDPQSREHCLEGYVFLLESIYEYKLKKKLQLLLEVAGAKVVYAETCSQNLRDRLVYVIPAGMTSNTKKLHDFNCSQKVKEIELISAIASGHLDPSIMQSAQPTPVLVTSSCSTDETVVADSDLEMETATSIHTSVAVDLIESDDDCAGKTLIHKIESDEKDGITVIKSSENDSTMKTVGIKTNEMESQGFVHTNSATFKSNFSDTLSKSDNATLSSEIKDGIMEPNSLDHEYGIENLDVIFSQDLIVRETNFPRPGYSILNGASNNFKRFRKTSVPSGNSFNNLIPFAKHPYEESDYGNEDVAESIKQEKKQKQMEAIADDLFNNDKVRKRGAAGTGTLQGLFARR